jgi:hypothetical protein
MPRVTVTVRGVKGEFKLAPAEVKALLRQAGGRAVEC